MNLLSKSAFAASRGWSRQYVGKLAEQGRLVMTPSGKIDVTASEQLLAQTMDPSKVGVTARHKQDKLQRGVRSAIAPPPDITSAAQIDVPDFQAARARREHYLAEQAESEARKMNGELVERAAVERAAFEAGRLLRDLVLGVAAQIASELAVISDPWALERHLTGALRQVLEDAERMSHSDLEQALSITS